MEFRHAIVRRPARTFADGLTSGTGGAPSLERALEQHARYCEALQRCGLALTVLEADDRYPDSTFVEDTAVIAGGRAIVTQPGAPSRRGETSAIRDALAAFFERIEAMDGTATLDGGDVCDAGETVYVGISQRTNHAGAQQLANLLAPAGKTINAIEMRDVPGLLHLKSGMSYLGKNCFVVVEALVPLLALPHDRVIRTIRAEDYGANCVRVNDAVLVANGHPHLEADLHARGMRTIALDVSEFRKMDGGLSCLSLRF